MLEILKVPNYTISKILPAIL